MEHLYAILVSIVSITKKAHPDETGRALLKKINIQIVVRYFARPVIYRQQQVPCRQA
jgi:hypothetical protein